MFPAMIEENAMTMEHAAIRLGCCRETVRRWLRDGRLKAIRLNRRATLVTEESVVAMGRELAARNAGQDE
jgi:excisionase family DNA binding protein